MPTDRTRFDWNNTGVHRAGRNVHLESDCRVLVEMQPLQKPATWRNQLPLAFTYMCGKEWAEECRLWAETHTEELHIWVNKNTVMVGTMECVCVCAHWRLRVRVRHIYSMSRFKRQRPSTDPRLHYQSHPLMDVFVISVRFCGHLSASAVPLQTFLKTACQNLNNQHQPDNVKLGYHNTQINLRRSAFPYSRSISARSSA